MRELKLSGILKDLDICFKAKKSFIPNFLQTTTNFFTSFESFILKQRKLTFLPD